MSYGNRYSNVFSRRASAASAKANSRARVVNPRGSISPTSDHSKMCEVSYVHYENCFSAFRNATQLSFNALFGETDLAKRVRKYYDDGVISLYVNMNAKFLNAFKSNPRSFDIASAIKAEFCLMVDDYKHPREVRDHTSTAPLYIIVCRAIHPVADLVRLFGTPKMLFMDHNIHFEEVTGVHCIETLAPLVDEGVIGEEIFQTEFYPITNGGWEMQRRLSHAWYRIQTKVREKLKKDSDETITHRAGVPEENNQHPVSSS